MEKTGHTLPVAVQRSYELHLEDLGSTGVGVDQRWPDE